jgi:hypothetical protein
MHRPRHAKRTGGKKFGAVLAVIGLAGALVLSLAVPAALAKTGGIKVDDDHDCFSSLREDNTLSPGVAELGIVWLNLPSNTLEGPYEYVIYDDGVAITDPNGTPLTFNHCTSGDTNYYWAYFTIPYVEGSVTLVVYNPDGTVGADSFRIVD